MSWFRRKPTVTEKLIASIIEGELKRREVDGQLEAKRADFELRKLELEGQQLEARGEEQRRDRADREKLRQDRQKHAAHIREIRAQKKQLGEQQQLGACRVCVNPGEPSLTAREIEWHSMGHREGSLWAN